MEQTATKNTSPKKFTFFETLLLPWSRYNAYLKAQKLINTPDTKQIDIIRALRKLTDYYVFDEDDEVIGDGFYLYAVIELIREKRLDLLDRIARNNLREFETDFI